MPCVFHASTSTSVPFREVLTNDYPLSFQKERPDTFGDSLAAKLDLTSAHQNQLEALSAQRDGRKDGLQEHGFRSNTDNSRDDASSQRLLDDLLNGNVKNMDLSGNRDLLTQRLNSSKAGDLDSGGRVGRSYHSSGPLRRDFSPSSSSNMAVGSSTLFTRSQSDMEARQKNLLDDKNVAAGLQQQMSSNRPDVFSDVNRSGKSSYENRPSGIDIKARGHGTIFNLSFILVLFDCLLFLSCLCRKVESRPQKDAVIKKRVLALHQNLTVPNDYCVRFGNSLRVASFFE